MHDYRQHLSEESLEALSVLSESKIQSVLSHSCDIEAGSSILTVVSLSIPIGKRKFLIIENDWADTPRDWINYYFLSARIATSPANIWYESEPGRGGANYKGDHLTLHLGAQNQVARIDVLSAVEMGSRESVHYDAGLLITREDGLKLAIVRQESITGFLRIAYEARDITELTAGLIIRVSLGPRRTLS
ncbi:MAG TPA: hypothetical protein VFT46_08530 [Holophagaceae bacterium]|nr:hypothetical protein [Holophagaceae bacterium]